MEEMSITMMERAIEVGETVRCITSPNPWVGCVLVTQSGEVFTGATYEDSKNHAEVVALNKAGSKAQKSTMYVTLEPCCHQGKTSPCTDSIISSGVKKVVIATLDPDKKVSGHGIERLRNAGVDVELGLCEELVVQQLAPYIKHRKTGTPYVVLKSAITLDGNIADTKGNSKWITGDMARADSHKLRAESDLIVVGANTIRTDNPSLTVRDWQPTLNPLSKDIDPKRVVFGIPDSDANVQPCESFSGDVMDFIRGISNTDVLQVLVEGGADVARQFIEADLVDKFVFYIAPAMLGGVGTNVFSQTSSKPFEQLWRGEFQAVYRLGSDIRLDVVRKENDSF